MKKKLFIYQDNLPADLAHRFVNVDRVSVLSDTFASRTGYDSPDEFPERSFDMYECAMRNAISKLGSGNFRLEGRLKVDAKVVGFSNIRFLEYERGSKLIGDRYYPTLRVRLIAAAYTTREEFEEKNLLTNANNSATVLQDFRAFNLGGRKIYLEGSLTESDADALDDFFRKSDERIVSDFEKEDAEARHSTCSIRGEHPQLKYFEFHNTPKSD